MEFMSWPKIPRLSKEKVTVTEKIDGTNSAIRIRPKGMVDESNAMCHVGVVTEPATVWVQSRKRFLQPTKEQDNFGFASWVNQNAEELVKLLGYGDHYGEWWGSGIQCSYGLKEKRFSLFNAPRWYEVLHPTEAVSAVPNLYIVPTLYTGSFDELDIISLKADLLAGSKAVPGFKAEGMVVFLRELNASYKVLLDGDELHKWETKSE